MIEFKPRNVEFIMNYLNETLEGAIENAEKALFIVKSMEDCARNFANEFSFTGTFILKPIDFEAFIYANSDRCGDYDEEEYSPNESYDAEKPLCIFEFYDAEQKINIIVGQTGRLEENGVLGFTVWAFKEKDGELYHFDIDTREWKLIKREPIREVHEAMEPVSVVLERQPSEAEEKAILQRNEKMIQLCERSEFDGFLKYDARLLIEEKDVKNVELILIPDQPECFGMLIRYDKKNKEFCLCQDIVWDYFYSLFLEAFNDEDDAIDMADEVMESERCIFRSKNIEDFIQPIKKLLDHRYIYNPTIIIPLNKDEHITITPACGEVKISFGKPVHMLSNGAKKNAKMVFEDIGINIDFERATDEAVIAEYEDFNY